MPAEWQVVGGEGKGGVIVREQQCLKSSACRQRLSTGSRILEELLVKGRLKYTLLVGNGPAQGWVSVQTPSKTLLQRLSSTTEYVVSQSLELACLDEEQDPETQAGAEVFVSDGNLKTSAGADSAGEALPQDKTTVSQDDLLDGGKEAVASANAVASQTSSDLKLWEVIGGADKGGIVVRHGRHRSSDVLGQRLATGARVREVELDGGRLHFARHSGSGPSSGWVSICAGGKDLLVRIEERSTDLLAQLGEAEPTPKERASSGWTWLHGRDKRIAGLHAHQATNAGAVGQAAPAAKLADTELPQGAKPAEAAAVARQPPLPKVPPPRGDVLATLQYLVHDGRPPFNYMYPRSDGGEQSHGAFEACEVLVHDARPNAEALSLDREGMILVPHETALSTTDFYENPAKIWQEYYREMEDLVRMATGASKVVAFDHNLRNPRDMKFRRGVVGYVPYAHNDYTPESAPMRVQESASDCLEADELLSRRYMIINIWRSISDELVIADPFAVCDGRTVPPEHYVPHDLIHKDKKGQTYSVTEGPEHRWLYFSGMSKNEAMLVKCFDSSMDLQTVRWTAHSGFIDPRAPADAPVRESIDARCLVFFASGDEVRTGLSAGQLAFERKSVAAAD